MARQTIVIDHPAQLDRLRVLPGARTPGLGRIRLSADQGLDTETRTQFEQRLNRLYFACGCDTAALFMTVAVGGYAAAILLGFTEMSGVAPWVIGLLVLAAAAGLGKVAGRYRAERQFRTAVAELKAKWRKPVPVSEELIGCG